VVAYTRPYLVDNIASIRALAGIGDDYFQVGVLIKDLLHPPIVAAFRGDRCALFFFWLSAIFFLVVADVAWSGEELRRLVRRGL
jgi:hypothetical protein